MNKKIFFKAMMAIFAVALVSFSCRKVKYDYVDGKNPDERVREFMEDVRSKLVNAQNGWVAYMYVPSTNKGFTFYMQFKDKGRVSMYSDFVDSTAGTAKESSFSIRNTGIPSLIFDTYNYIHMPADPAKSVSGGADGTGQASDFEYSILKATTDTMILKGNLKGCVLTMIQIGASDLAKLQSDSWSSVIDEFKDYFLNNSNNYISLTGDRKLGISLTSSTRQVSYQILESDGNVSGYSGTFFYNVNGLAFSDDFIYGDTRFVRAEIRDGKMYVFDAKNKEYEVKQNKTPLTPLISSFSFNGTYSKMHIEGETLPAGVTSGWNDIYSRLVTRFNNSSGRTILYMDFNLQNGAKARVTIRYQATTGSQYTADAEYDYEINGDIIKLTNYVPSISNSNWNTRINDIGPEIVDYFKDNSFKIDWAEGSGQEVLGGLNPVNNPGDYFFGILQK